MRVSAWIMGTSPAVLPPSTRTADTVNSSGVFTLETRAASLQNSGLSNSAR